jgi:predicted transcriptional regulator
MPDLKIEPALRDRLHRFAAARNRSPDAILHEALTRYLDSLENPGAKNYPTRTPVGGIITPV